MKSTLRTVTGTKHRRAPQKNQKTGPRFFGWFSYEPGKPPTMGMVHVDAQAEPTSRPEPHNNVLERESSAGPKNAAVPSNYKESLAPILRQPARAEPLVRAHVVSQSVLAHSAKYSGRVKAVDGNRVIIEFEVEGEDEEREFSREGLSIDDGLLKVGCRVVATTSLEFLRQTEPPTPDEKRAIRSRREELEKKWSEIDPRQTPIVPGIGS